MFLNRMRRLAWWCVLALASGCAISRAPALPRLALLAPFEGEQRAIGYEALYAARLAIEDAGLVVELYPVDDGGTLASAADRARALAGDPLTMMVLLFGDRAASGNVQTNLADLPALIVGDLSTTVSHERVFRLDQETTPTPDYIERLQASDPFAPRPGTLSMLAYDAARVSAQAVVQGSRAQAVAALLSTDYNGLTGRINMGEPRP